ncbi:unnamed protein product, partial [Allacma fusca]
VYITFPLYNYYTYGVRETWSWKYPKRNHVLSPAGGQRHIRTIYRNGYCNLWTKNLLYHWNLYEFHLHYLSWCRLLEMAPSDNWFIAAKLFPDNFNLILGASELFVGIAEFTALSIGGALHGAGGFALAFISFGALNIISIAFHIFLLPSDQKKTSVIADSQLENPVYDGPEHTKNKQEVTTDERHLSPLKLSSSQTAAMFQITIVLYGIVCPLWGFLADKMTRTWILIVSGLVLGGGAFYLLGPLPIFGLDNTVWSNIISLVVITVGVSLANIPATEACLLSTIEAGLPDETATCAMVCSLISTGYSLGSVIGSFAAGFLVEGIGYPLTSAVFGSIMLAYGLIIILYFLIFHKPNKRLRARGIVSGTSTRRSGKVNKKNESDLAIY